MSKTPKYTPLPYFFDEGYECQPGIYTEPRIYVPGECICQLTLLRNGNTNETHRERVMETGRFIQRACNSHYELLEACKAALDMPDGVPVAEWNYVRDMLRAAIARADQP